MKPPANAVVLKLDACTEQPVMDGWGILLSEGIPLVLHRSTGLVYAICKHAPEEDRVYAVALGQDVDEHGNHRKIGRIAMERIGQDAITVYLHAVAGYLQTVAPQLHETRPPEVTGATDD